MTDREPMSESEDFIKQSDLCLKLGVRKTTIWRWMKRGLPHYRPNAERRWVRFRWSEVEAWLAGNGLGE